MPVVGFAGEISLAEELFSTDISSERLQFSFACNSDEIPNSKIEYMNEEVARKSKGYIFEELKGVF